MTTFNVRRNRQLVHKYRGIRLDEHDLFRLAKLIQARLEFAGGGSIDIEIVSPDGRDTISTDDPAYLTSADMPAQFKSLSISGEQHHAQSDIAPLACRVALPVVPIGPPTPTQPAGGPPFFLIAHPAEGRVEVSVEGTNVEGVNSLFAELQREFDGCRARAPISTAMFSHPAVHLVLWVLCTSVFTTLLMLGPVTVVGTPELPPIILSMLVAGTISVLFSVFVVYPLVRLAFPAIAFGGRLSRRSTKARALLATVITLIVIPFAVNLVSNWASGRLSQQP